MYNPKYQPSDIGWLRYNDTEYGQKILQIMDREVHSEKEKDALFYWFKYREMIEPSVPRVYEMCQMVDCPEARRLQHKLRHMEEYKYCSPWVYNAYESEVRFWLEMFAHVRIKHVDYPSHWRQMRTFAWAERHKMYVGIVKGV